MLTEQEKELEMDIYKCKEIHTSVIEKIAQLQFLLQPQTTRPSKPVSLAVTGVLPTSTPVVTPQCTNTGSQSVTEQGYLTHMKTLYSSHPLIQWPLHPRRTQSLNAM